MSEKETTNFKLPYPTSAGETKNGAVDIEELAVKVDEVLHEHTLIYKAHALPYEAKSGELGVQTFPEGKTTTLPSAATANQIIGVWCAETGVYLKITTSGGAVINGDFTKEASTITLNALQHVVLQSDGTNWLIIAGEPQREKKYTKETVLANETKTIGTRPVLITLTAVTTFKEVEVNQGGSGVVICNLAGLTSLTFEAEAGAKWKCNAETNAAILTR